MERGERWERGQTEGKGMWGTEQGENRDLGTFLQEGDRRGREQGCGDIPARGGQNREGTGMWGHSCKTGTERCPEMRQRLEKKMMAHWKISTAESSLG